MAFFYLNTMYGLELSGDSVTRGTISADIYLYLVHGETIGNAHLGKRNGMQVVDFATIDTLEMHMVGNIRIISHLILFDSNPLDHTMVAKKIQDIVDGSTGN